MKTILIILIFALMQNILLSKDIFDSKLKTKDRIKISSYAKQDGSVLSIDDIHKNRKVIQNIKDKAVSVQSSKKNLIPGKYIYHRLDNNTYESKDLRNWKLFKNEISPELNSKTVTDKSVIITPNPVIDYLNIQGLSGQKYEIYSMFGLKVLEGEYHSKIDISALPSGIYLLKTSQNFNKFIKI
jgi:hypothetical protein